MAKKIVAIIGRPNVGKSTFFNVLSGESLAIIEDSPGVTRDRIYASCSWQGVDFTIIDTGGIEPVSSDEMQQQIKRQATLALEMSDVILFITDLKSGVMPQDIEIANMLRKTKKKVIVVVNKSDRVGKTPDELYDFYNLGFGDVFAISAKAKLGLGEVLDEIVNSFKDNLLLEENDDEKIKVAIIGKPNVGKSSLVNKILKEERVIVSNEAGTTRDSIDSEFENKYGKYIFIDTAGIRKKSKVYETIEKYSVIKAKAAIDRADIAMILIDATEGVTDQDEKIAGHAVESGKGIIIVVNKWDLIDKEEISMNKYIAKIRESFKFMSYAPIIMVSTLTGQRIEKLFEMINKVNAANKLRISTSILNDILMQATAITPPPTDKGRRLKIYYSTQVKAAPPTFVLFVNDKALAHFSYLRYIENTFRKNFELEGTPIILLVREKKGQGKDKYK